MKACAEPPAGSKALARSFISPNPSMTASVGPGARVKSQLSPSRSEIHQLEWIDASPRGSVCPWRLCVGSRTQSQPSRNAELPGPPAGLGGGGGHSGVLHCGEFYLGLHPSAPCDSKGRGYVDDPAACRGGGGGLQAHLI